MEIDIYKIFNVKKNERTIPQKNDLIMLVGVYNNKITETGCGNQIFLNIDEARKIFPELNPVEGSENFTSSQGYESLSYNQYLAYSGSKKVAVRFETKNAFNFLSH